MTELDLRRSGTNPYLIFVISFTQITNNKYYTPKKQWKTSKTLQISQKNQNICIFLRSIWKILHLTEKFYTGTACDQCPWELSDIDKPLPWRLDLVQKFAICKRCNFSKPITEPDLEERGVVQNQALTGFFWTFLQHFLWDTSSPAYMQLGNLE